MVYVFVVFFLLLGAIIGVWWLRKKVKRREARRYFQADDREAWRKTWGELEELLEGPATHWKIALVEADQLIDRVTKEMHIPGRDLGERLRFLTRTRPELGYIYEARRTRNRLIHEQSFQLDKSAARRAMSIFRRALKDLGVL